MSDAVEADTRLLPLPKTPFVPTRWNAATVGPDIHIKVGRTLYPVPWRLIGRRVDVRSTQAFVQVFHEGELVRAHTALEQGKRTHGSDYPPEKIVFHVRTPTWCRSQSAQVGVACREFIDQLLEVNALYRLRAAQGVLGLRKKYGDEQLEAACARPALVGGPSCRTIKGSLVAGTETEPAPESAGGGSADTSGRWGGRGEAHGDLGVGGQVSADGRRPPHSAVRQVEGGLRPGRGGRPCGMTAKRRRETFA
ncbi:hypothetical protein ABZX44_33250 [Streptomyces antibioticus]